MTAPSARDPLSYFWSPLCAVGAHGERPNAQICVSVFSASIVPERPRLLVGLWNENYTHDLVKRSGTLAITLLARGQSALLEPLGLRSGRADDKLAGLDYQLTPAGDPYFAGAVAYIDCAVIEAFDWGDATGFLVAVRKRETLAGGEPLTWADARGGVAEDFLRRWDEKSRSDREAAARVMRWV